MMWTRLSRTLPAVLAPTLLAIGVGNATAGWNIGTVRYMSASTTGGHNVAYVTLNGAYQSNQYQPRPPCLSTDNGFTVNLDTPAGRAQYATLLGAWHAGTSVGIAGTSACTLLPTAEDIEHVDVAAGR